MKKDSFRNILGILAMAFMALIVNGERAWAMPMFARKYKVDCSMCHAAVPRLNYLGFKFKAAGFRMPWEVGKAQPDDTLHLENYTAFVSFINANATVTSNTKPPENASVSVQEVDFHPITGSWGENWSSGFEVDAMPDGTVSVNQAFVGYTSGSEDAFWTLDGGVTPNFLSYGPLDRPLAISTPLVLSTSASNPLEDTLFNWSGPRAAGVTASCFLNDTYLSASARNRLNSTSSGLDSVGPSKSNHMGDILLSATQFYDHRGAGSAVSLAYYQGQTHLALPDGSGGYYLNNYKHAVGAMNYYLTDKINLFGGAGWGADQTEDVSSGTLQHGLYHVGEFGGIEYFWSPKMAVGARYDYFRSDVNTSGTDTKEGTLYYHFRPVNQVIFSTEYQLQKYGSQTSQPGAVQSVGTLQLLFAF